MGLKFASKAILQSDQIALFRSLLIFPSTGHVYLNRTYTF